MTHSGTRAARQIVASPDNAFAAERVEVLLREPAQLGIRTRAQCLVYLGKHFRAVRLDVKRDARSRSRC